MTLNELKSLLGNDRPQQISNTKVKQMIRARQLWIDLFDVFAISRYDFDEAYEQLIEVLDRYGFENKNKNKEI